MNGDDDIAVIAQEEMENISYPVNATDDFPLSSHGLQLYIGSGKSENDSASLHALRNAYHDLKLRYNEQTNKVNTMRQAIKDMEAQRIQNSNRPYILNSGAAYAEAAGAGSLSTAAGAVEANPQLRANLGYAESLQRQILRLKNSSAVREKEMERKYSDLYGKYKRLEADVTTLQQRNRKTAAELEKVVSEIQGKDILIEQLTTRCKLLETKVSKQSPETFSEESRLQEKQTLGMLEKQTQFINDLKVKIKEQNQIILAQTDMIKKFAEIKRDHKAAEDQARGMYRQPEGALEPYHVLEEKINSTRLRLPSHPTRTEGIIPQFSAHGHPVQNTESSADMESRHQYMTAVRDRLPYAQESLADVEAGRSEKVMKIESRGQGHLTVSHPVTPQDQPDSPVMRRASHMVSPKFPASPVDQSYSMARYLSPESKRPHSENLDMQRSRLRLEDATLLADTMYQGYTQPNKQGPVFENQKQIQALHIDDKKLNFNDTFYQPSAVQGPVVTLDHTTPDMTYIPREPAKQENNYENISVYLPPTALVTERDYVNVSDLVNAERTSNGQRDLSRGSESQKCPVCAKNFQAKAIDDFQLHVLECMDRNEESLPVERNISENGARECPMCAAVFPAGLPQEEFERHVQEHFGEDPVMERFEVLQP